MSSGLLAVSPLESWQQPILRLPGMRALCRSDYLLVTPSERDRLIREELAEDYQPPQSQSLPVAVVEPVRLEPEPIALPPAPQDQEPLDQQEPVSQLVESTGDEADVVASDATSGEKLMPRPSRRRSRGNAAQ